MSPEMNNFIRFLARLAVEDYLREINYRGAVNEVCGSAADDFERKTSRNRSKDLPNPGILEMENTEDR